MTITTRYSVQAALLSEVEAAQAMAARSKAEAELAESQCKVERLRVRCEGLAEVCIYRFCQGAAFAATK